MGLRVVQVVPSGLRAVQAVPSGLWEVQAVPSALRVVQAVPSGLRAVQAVPSGLRAVQAVPSVPAKPHTEEALLGPGAPSAAHLRPSRPAPRASPGDPRALAAASKETHWASPLVDSGALRTSPSARREPRQNPTMVELLDSGEILREARAPRVAFPTCRNLLKSGPSCRLRGLGARPEDSSALQMVSKDPKTDLQETVTLGRLPAASAEDPRSGADQVSCTAVPQVVATDPLEVVGSPLTGDKGRLEVTK